MEINIYPWGDHRRYNSYTDRIRDYFGERIQKVSLDAGFNCPNRDGTLGYGGCSFCIGENFIPSYCTNSGDLKAQIDDGIEFHRKRYRRASKYIAYLQAYSNTYAPLSELRRIYKEVLSHPSVYGLCISTRPDCVDDKIFDLLTELSGSYPVFLELGIESCYDNTLAVINRGHNFHQSEIAILAAVQRNIPVTIHMIFGLPGETRENMLEEASILSNLPISAVKFHQLQIFKNTPVCHLFEESPELFHSFTLESYTDFIVDFLEKLNPDIAIERLAAESPPRYNLINGWDHIRVEEVHKKIESVMELRETCQGIKFKKSINIPAPNNFN